MIKLGRRPGSSGGINEPRRLDGPEPGANELFRSANGLFSRITSIFGASTGALISGTLTAGTSYITIAFRKQTKEKHIHKLSSFINESVDDAQRYAQLFNKYNDKSIHKNTNHFK